MRSRLCFLTSLIPGDTYATELAVKSINTIRVLAADIVQKANSGHPG